MSTIFLTLFINELSLSELDKGYQINNIMLMVPRIDWKAGMIFKPINTASIAGTRATDYFCINSNNEVWMCITSPNTVTLENSEPLLSNEKVTINEDNKKEEDYIDLLVLCILKLLDLVYF